MVLIRKLEERLERAEKILEERMRHERAEERARVERIRVLREAERARELSAALTSAAEKAVAVKQRRLEHALARAALNAKQKFSRQLASLPGRACGTRLGVLGELLTKGS